jgi:hypothetical protein
VDSFKMLSLKKQEFETETSGRIRRRDNSTVCICIKRYRQSNPITGLDRP